VHEKIKSPCIRNCCLDDNGICLGCRRSLEEIKQWQASTNKEKLTIFAKSKGKKKIGKIIAVPLTLFRSDFLAWYTNV